jgi:hypothetical protein
VTRAALVGVGFLVIVAALAASLALAPQELQRDDGVDPRPGLARPITGGDRQRPIRLVAVDPGKLHQPTALALPQPRPAPVSGATSVAPVVPAPQAPVGTAPLDSSR